MNEKEEHTNPSIIPGHIPNEEEIQYKLGPYQIIRSIGKGGMGEVLLAYDTVLGRRIALKRIREDLVEHKAMHARFLKEARITCQLTHPAIIPIYSIQEDENHVYYTMPFVQGETLKTILNKTRDQQRNGEKLNHIGGSIPALINIFVTVCQAIAYAHSKGILHRDLKPDNIIIGPYGEILILDWGLATLIKDEEELGTYIKEPSNITDPEITRAGKVVGTVAYMAPERVKGHSANIKSDIYSLGAILYHILTLHTPFRRGNIKEFRKNVAKEKLRNPSEVAPYRDIPRVLGRIAMKCLASTPEDRYSSVDALIKDIQNYIEGRSEWFQTAELDIQKKEDWEFQENVFIAEHIAITRSTEVSHWVWLMISKASFAGNTKIEAEIKIGNDGQGVGFLMSVPEAAERRHLNDGYCLWLGSDLNKSTKLLRSTVEVLSVPELYLNRNEWYHIRIEKIDHNIYFYLNDVLQFSYISYLPIVGTHIGLLSRDDRLEVKNLNVSVGSHSITVNCLAVPDALLAHKDYAAALNEYRRIGYSFPDRKEGREAIFRAGVTLLDLARSHTELDRIETLYEMALNEFEKLHDTPGAPLEYLGKALVYHVWKDYEEEAKCFELALRRYPNHPLLPVLHEQIIYRMHEFSHFDRKATYQFVLLVVRYLPKDSLSMNAKNLFESLRRNWEPLSFIEEDSNRDALFSIILNFWLAKPYAIIEIIEEISKQQPYPSITISNALFCLLELGSWKLVKKIIETLPSEDEEIKLVNIALLGYEKSVFEALKKFFSTPKQHFNAGEIRLLRFLLELSTSQGDAKAIQLIAKHMEFSPLPPEVRIHVDSIIIWGELLKKNWAKAGEILHTYPLTILAQETTQLHILYGCWLYVTEGESIAKAQFSGMLEVPFPRTWTLLGHYFNGRFGPKDDWHHKAFLWEKRQLHKQLTIFFHCIDDLENKTKHQNLEREQYLE